MFSKSVDIITPYDQTPKELDTETILQLNPEYFILTFTRKDNMKDLIKPI